MAETGKRQRAQGKETIDLRWITLDIEAVDFVLRFFLILW